MIDYKKGQLYTIRCKDDNNLIYVGSTTQMLCERLAQHKKASQYDKYKNVLLYMTIGNDWNNWYIERYELCPCDCKEELKKREGELIREIGNLNMRIEGRTGKEYYNDYKENILIQRKNTYYNNKEEILKKRKVYYLENKNELLDKMKVAYQKRKAKKVENQSADEMPYNLQIM